jgi:hypothetical protein
MKVRYVPALAAAALLTAFVSLACADTLGDRLAQRLCTKKASATLQLTADEARAWQEAHTGSYPSGAGTYTFTKGANADGAECGVRKTAGVTCGIAAVTKSGRWLYLGRWEGCPAEGASN